MPRQALEAQLSQLREELAETETLDSKTRELLSEVADEIEQVLGEDTGDNASARERLETAAYKFEAEHPRFAAILGEISDTLAKLGI